MRHKVLILSALVVAFASRSFAQGSSSTDPVTLAQQQITHYLSRLADLHCTEIVTQQKLNAKGHVDATEHSQFDYLIMMNGTDADFQLNESRIESPEAKHKLLTMPMLTTNGITTVLLIFHPYYRDSYNFEPRPEEVVAGRAAVPIHFAHISGRRTPAALALRGREYPIELEGTAWLDKASGEVVKVQASLQRDMSDVGLRSLNIQVDYKDETVGKDTMMLPLRAVVDVATPRQHWRNTHAFESYKSFSADAEQDPNYKLHVNPAEATGANSVSPDGKEKEKP
jgi:hypothetical protein